MTDEEMVRIAKEHGGRYLISQSDWRNKESAMRKTCERLVHVGRARWMTVKYPGEYGEPGPGIQLIGRDAA